MLEGGRAARSLIRYIDVVLDFKKAVRSGEIRSKEFQNQQRKLRDFFSEARGRRRGVRTGEIDYISRHGKIVDALHKWRLSRPLSRQSG